MEIQGCLKARLGCGHVVDSARGLRTLSVCRKTMQGAAGAQSLSKTSKSATALISKKGHVFFEMPATAAAQPYKISGESAQSFARIKANPLTDSLASVLV